MEFNSGFKGLNTNLNRFLRVKVSPVICQFVFVPGNVAKETELLCIATSDWSKLFLYGKQARFFYIPCI